MVCLLERDSGPNAFEKAVGNGALQMAPDLRELFRRRREVLDALCSYGFLSDRELTEDQRAVIEGGFLLQSLGVYAATQPRRLQ